MGAALRVANGDLMFLTGMTTVCVVCSVRKKTAKHAMLGVENGQVRIGDHFQSRAGDFLGQFANLLRIQIIRRSDAGQPHVEIGPSRQCVGRVKTKVANQTRSLCVGSMLNQIVQQSARAYNDVTLKRSQKSNNILLARFQNPGTGNSCSDSSGLNFFQPKGEVHTAPGNQA